MEERYFVISDIEMGCGDVMDDFYDDEILIKFINSLANGYGKGKKVLILNGDIFDFLKMDYKGTYPRYVTEEISLWKLERVIAAHPKVFEAWRDFLKSSGHHLYFVIGNHDLDLVWPKLQERIRLLLGKTDQVEFGFTFDRGEIYAEHGHLLDSFYRHSVKKIIINYKGQKILNLPVGSQIVFKYLVPIKRKYPKEEQLLSSPRVYEKYPYFKKAIKKTMWRDGLKILFVHPFLHWGDPTYKVPYLALLKHILRYGLDFTNDDRFLWQRFKVLVKKYPAKKVFAMGHCHILTDAIYKNKFLLLTDTWRNEYKLVGDDMVKKEKTYAEIVSKNGIVEMAAMKVFIP